MSEDWSNAASRVLRQPLRRHSAGEMTASTCPVCGKGDDRLVVFREGNFWCRKCNHRGFWDQSIQAGRDNYKPDLLRVNQVKRNQMAGCRDWLDYHDNVLEDDSLKQVWLDRGMVEAEISKWGLGYAPICPTYQDSPSLTVPVWLNSTLVDIRHRLLNGSEGKYRSHKPGLLASTFNLDSTGSTEQVVLVEGEIKTIILSRVYKSVVGIPGLQHSVADLAKTLDPLQTVVILFDPGSEQESTRVAEELRQSGIRSRIAYTFDKPDDLLLEFGEDVIKAVVEQAIPYK
jgi:hypothetical protein